jgi:hypothetical protein
MDPGRGGGKETTPTRNNPERYICDLRFMTAGPDYFSSPICVYLCVRVRTGLIVWIGNSDGTNGRLCVLYMSPGSMPFSFLFPHSSDPVFFGDVVYFFFSLSSLFFFLSLAFRSWHLFCFFFFYVFFHRIVSPSVYLGSRLKRCCSIRLNYGHRKHGVPSVHDGPVRLWNHRVSTISEEKINIIHAQQQS